MKRTANPWLWIPSLYLAEGMPNAIVVTVAVVVLKTLGIDNGHVALYTSLLYLPWVIKPFWAPFVDIFGSKRRWIVAMQLALGVTLGAVSAALQTPVWLSITLVALWLCAFASATHDIAADGFYLLALDQRRQAYFVGIRSTFYRAASMIASGGVVWLAGYWIVETDRASDVWSVIFALLALFFVSAALYHSFVLPYLSVDKVNVTKSASDVFVEFKYTVYTFFRLPGVGVAVAFILLYRLPESVLCKMVQPFLIDSSADGGMGLSVDGIGIANGAFGVTGIVAGGIVGGIVIARYGLRRCLWPMALSLTLPSAFYCWLAAHTDASFPIVCGGIALEQFGYGFGFTAYMVYMMKFCDSSRFATSHYAFCTGLMALGLMLPGLVSGWLQQHLGYGTFFTVVMVLSLATFAVTALVMKSNKLKI